MTRKEGEKKKQSKALNSVDRKTAAPSGPPPIRKRPRTSDYLIDDDNRHEDHSAEDPKTATSKTTEETRAVEDGEGDELSTLRSGPEYEPHLRRELKASSDKLFGPKLRIYSGGTSKQPKYSMFGTEQTDDQGHVIRLSPFQGRDMLLAVGNDQYDIISTKLNQQWADIMRGPSAPTPVPKLTEAFEFPDTQLAFWMPPRLPKDLSLSTSLAVKFLIEELHPKLPELGLESLLEPCSLINTRGDDKGADTTEDDPTHQASSVLYDLDFTPKECDLTGSESVTTAENRENGSRSKLASAQPPFYHPSGLVWNTLFGTGASQDMSTWARDARLNYISWNNMDSFATPSALADHPLVMAIGIVQLLPNQFHSPLSAGSRVISSAPLVQYAFSMHLMLFGGLNLVPPPPQGEDREVEPPRTELAYAADHHYAVRQLGRKDLPPENTTVTQAQINVAFIMRNLSHMQGAAPRKDRNKLLAAAILKDDPPLSFSHLIATLLGEDDHSNDDSDEDNAPTAHKYRVENIFTLLGIGSLNDVYSNWVCRFKPDLPSLADVAATQTSATSHVLKAIVDQVSDSSDMPIIAFKTKRTRVGKAKSAPSTVASITPETGGVSRLAMCESLYRREIASLTQRSDVQTSFLDLHEEQLRFTSLFVQGSDDDILTMYRTSAVDQHLEFLRRNWDGNPLASSFTETLGAHTLHKTGGSPARIRATRDLMSVVAVLKAILREDRLAMLDNLEDRIARADKKNTLEYPLSTSSIPLEDMPILELVADVVYDSLTTDDILDVQTGIFNRRPAGQKQSGRYGTIEEQPPHDGLSDGDAPDGDEDLEDATNAGLATTTGTTGKTTARTPSSPVTALFRSTPMVRSAGSKTRNVPPKNPVQAQRDPTPVDNKVKPVKTGQGRDGPKNRNVQKSGPPSSKKMKADEPEDQPSSSSDSDDDDDDDDDDDGEGEKHVEKDESVDGEESVDTDEGTDSQAAAARHKTGKKASTKAKPPSRETPRGALQNIADAAAARRASEELARIGHSIIRARAALSAPPPAAIPPFHQRLLRTTMTEAALVPARRPTTDAGKAYELALRVRKASSLKTTDTVLLLRFYAEDAVDFASQKPPAWDAIGAASCAFFRPTSISSVETILTFMADASLLQETLSGVPPPVWTAQWPNRVVVPAQEILLRQQTLKEMESDPTVRRQGVPELPKTLPPRPKPTNPPNTLPRGTSTSAKGSNASHMSTINKGASSRSGATGNTIGRRERTGTDHNRDVATPRRPSSQITHRNVDDDEDDDEEDGDSEDDGDRRGGKKGSEHRKTKRRTHSTRRGDYDSDERGSGSDEDDNDGQRGPKLSKVQMPNGSLVPYNQQHKAQRTVNNNTFAVVALDEGLAAATHYGFPHADQSKFYQMFVQKVLQMKGEGFVLKCQNTKFLNFMRDANEGKGQNLVNFNFKNPNISFLTYDDIRWSDFGSRPKVDRKTRRNGIPDTLWIKDIITRLGVCIAAITDETVLSAFEPIAKLFDDPTDISVSVFKPTFVLDEVFGALENVKSVIVAHLATPQCTRDSTVALLRDTLTDELKSAMKSNLTFEKQALHSVREAARKSFLAAMTPITSHSLPGGKARTTLKFDSDDGTSSDASTSSSDRKKKSTAAENKSKKSKSAADKRKKKRTEEKKKKRTASDKSKTGDGKPEEEPPKKSTVERKTLCLANIRFVLDVKDKDCSFGDKCNRTHATKKKPFKEADVRERFKALTDMPPLEVKKLEAALRTAVKDKNLLIKAT